MKKEKESKLFWEVLLITFLVLLAVFCSGCTERQSESAKKLAVHLVSCTLRAALEPETETEKSEETEKPEELKK